MCGGDRLIPRVRERGVRVVVGGVEEERNRVKALMDCVVVVIF